MVKPRRLPESILASLKAPLWGHYHSKNTYLNRYPQVLSHDCLVYREINLVDDQVILQRDLTALVNWTKT